MALKISGASVRRPVPALVLFAVLLVFGVIGFRALPITHAPNVDIPVVAVKITQAGAAPTELEQQVTKPIEDAIAGVAGVKHISSSVTDGVSQTWIEFRLEVAPQQALDDVRDAVSNARADLPGTIDEPIVKRVDVVGQSIQTYAASARGMTLEQLSWFVDDTVMRALQSIPGVGRVNRIGGVTREIQIKLDPNRLSALGITAGEVNAQVRATSVDMAGGRGEVAGQEQTIRTLASASSLKALAATRIVLPGGRETRLSDIGQVVDAAEEPRTFARLDGTRAVVGFAIYRAKGASDVTVAKLVQQRLEALSTVHPDISYTLIDDSVRSTYGGFASAMQTLAEGAAFTILIVFLFLRDGRATLLSALALPLSIIPAFGAMWLMGFSLNIVSLLAITLVSGILVDDAIVEIENIVRHMRAGASPYRAAIEAADEIGLTVVTITLTIVGVFVPVSFMGGIAGQYFRQFGLTVAAAALASLLVARLITPVMAANLLRSEGHRETADGRVMRTYLRLLAFTLQHRTSTLLTGFVLFGVSVWSTTLLPTAFIPSEDDARAVLSLELPPGSTLDDTAARTDKVARAFLAVPEVESVFTIGGTTPTGADPELRRASMIVNLLPKAQRSRSQKKIEGDLSRRLASTPDVRGWYINDRGERELSVTVLGDKQAALDRGVASLESAMRRLPGFTNVVASAGAARPEIHIVPRGDEAARFGVSTTAIADAVRIGTIGEAGSNLAKFRDGDHLIPVRVEAGSALRGDLSLLRVLPVPAANETTVPLAAVADLDLGEGPSSIERYDRVRRVVIGADLARNLPLGQALQEVYASSAAQNLPAGIRLQKVGDAEIMDEVFVSFTNAMTAGLVIVLGLLVLLFGGVFQPLTILFSLPLSLGGVIVVLLAMNQPISLPVVVGILMLMGIVTKNAIMLVDVAIEQRALGVSLRDAIATAGRRRARPIVMTTLAMVAGMVPSALGLGDGGEFRSPMAMAVIGGLIVSTLLSLVFVPSFYTIMDDLSRAAARLLRRASMPHNVRPHLDATVAYGQSEAD